uniref:Uncharacterized protein n=1 Tax=Globisporangium ultimum (strain ATCC 200006 / CBS 805.95 / DAOM BR144) TaxID=431595 RepID=K3WYJ2_GLOUD
MQRTHASDCCDVWVNSLVKDYGYTVSDQLTKFAQLLGDVVCSRQMPSFLGNASQTCGYTFAQRINVFDVQALFSTTRCLKGSEFFPVAQNFFPPDVTDVVAAYFSKACVHIPAKYANKCSYARSVSLADWESKLSKVKAQVLGSGGSSVSSYLTSNIISFQTVAPSSSSAAAAYGGATSASVLAGVLSHSDS